MRGSTLLSQEAPAGTRVGADAGVVVGLGSRVREMGEDGTGVGAGSRVRVVWGSGVVRRDCYCYLLTSPLPLTRRRWSLALTLRS